MDLLPKKPVPFSSKYLYKEPERTYKLESYTKGYRWNLNEDPFSQKIDELNNSVGSKIQYYSEAFEK